MGVRGLKTEYKGLIDKMSISNYIFKILLVGEAPGSKTAFVKRYCFDVFKSHERLTIGVDFYSKTTIFKDEEIKLQIDEIEQRFQRQIEEQFEVIKKELSVITTTATKIEGMEDRLQALIEKERGEIKKELAVMTASKRRIDNELGDKLSDKWGIVVQLRSQTYNKLMKEYAKVEEKLILNRTEMLDEIIDNEPQEDEK